MIGWFDLQDWEKEELEENGLEIEVHEESLTAENYDGFDYDALCVFASSEVSSHP